MNQLFRSPRRSIAPYFLGYLNAHASGTRQFEGGLIRLPPQIYGDGSDAQTAFLQGVADSVVDRGPRLMEDRVSRAHPPWRRI